MSDYMVRVIPARPDYVFSEVEAEKMANLIKSQIQAESVSVKLSEEPFFVDCGSNLEEIKCPLCGKVIDFGWWGEAMDAAANMQFRDLSVILPCCGEKCSLDDLKYHFPCGFAMAEITILNPKGDLSEELMEQIEELAGTAVQAVHAHL